ncbi:MAG: hypothetical protein MJE68_22770 [Proteobacteria bacterium]|nr:hypothetical protein [Pseudomonadota bacterium]
MLAGYRLLAEWLGEIFGVGMGWIKKAKLACRSRRVLPYHRRFVMAGCRIGDGGEGVKRKSDFFWGNIGWVLVL